MEWDLTAQAEQSRREIGQQSLQPPQKRSFGLSTEAEIPGSNHTRVWPPSEMWKQKLLLQLRAPPQHVGSSGQERGSTHGAQRIPPTHTWVTPNTTVPHWKFNLKNLFTCNLREMRVLQDQAHKAGQFWTISEQRQLSFWWVKWSDTVMYSPNSQCTNLVLPFPNSWVLDFVQP